MAPNFLEILARLHDSGAEFVIVGGVAAVLHGGTRVTFDLDIVPRLETESWTATVELLWSMGARPRIPATLQQICDVDQVRSWQRDKGMLALNLRTPDGTTEVDLLVAESDGFTGLRDRALAVTVDGRTFHVASVDDLIDMKKRAGRPQDLLDIAHLESVKRRGG